MAGVGSVAHNRLWPVPRPASADALHAPAGQQFNKGFEIGPFARRNCNDHRPATPIAADVQLGREAPARAAQGVPVLPSSGTGRMLMSADDGAVHVVDGPVDLARRIGHLVQGAQNAVP